MEADFFYRGKLSGLELQDEIVRWLERGFTQLS
jgi:hypothetical protein